MATRTMTPVDATSAPSTRNRYGLAEVSTDAESRLRQLAVEVRNSARIGDEALALAGDSYLRCGALLLEAKALCAPGQWTAWLEREWVAPAGRSVRTAQLYMQLARNSHLLDGTSRGGGLRVMRHLVAAASEDDAEADAQQRPALPSPALPPALALRVEAEDLTGKQARSLAVAAERVQDETLRDFVHERVTDPALVPLLEELRHEQPAELEALLVTGYLQVGEEVLAAEQITARDLRRTQQEIQRQSYLQSSERGWRLVVTGMKTAVAAHPVNDCLTMRLNGISQQLRMGDTLRVTIEVRDE